MFSFKNKKNHLHLVVIFLLIIIFFNPYEIAKYGLLFLFLLTVTKGLKKDSLTNLFNSIQFWVLLIFCIFYATIQYSYNFIDFMDFIKYLIYPLALYIFSVLIISGIKCEKQLINYFYTVIVSLSLFGILAVLYSIRVYGLKSGGVMQIQAGMIPWAGEKELSATVLGTYLSLGIALYGLIFVKSSIYYKTLNILVSLPSLLSSIILANRTGLVIAASSIILIFLQQIKFNSVKQNIKLVSTYIANIFLFIFLYNINLFNVKKMWLQSFIYERLTKKGLYHDPRYVAWIEAFKGLFSDPLGGKQSKISLFYAHNLWLDVGWKTGLFTFVLLIIFTLIGLKNYSIIMKNNNVSLYFKYLISTIFCGFFVTSMVEPIMEANILFFCSFCFLLGIIDALNKKNCVI